MIYSMEITLFMSFENQAHSPQLDTQKGVFEGIAMPKNITIPAEMKERFAGLSPEEQERLLPDVSFQFSTL